MDGAPHDFILNFSNKDLLRFSSFKHRTFNGEDCMFFLKSLQSIYKRAEGLEAAFTKGMSENENVKQGIINFGKLFLKSDHPVRTEKHISNPSKGSAAKRINMFLRWMVRKDKIGVDFGIWNSIKPHQLCIPLDVHSGRVARKLGLLKRKQNDWKAVEELTDRLKQINPDDPIKYDFALFGLGAFEKF